MSSDDITFSLSLMSDNCVILVLKPVIYEKQTPHF